MYSLTHGAKRSVLLLDLSIAFAIGFLVLAYSLSPHEKYAIGGDEGFELTKAFMLIRGYELFNPMWSDQPPFLSYLLGWTMRLFGEDVSVARSLAAIFGAVLLFSVGTSVRLKMEFGGEPLVLQVVTPLLAIFFLLSSHHVLPLLLSIMAEPAAFCLGMVAVVFALAGVRAGAKTLLMVSAVVFAAAVLTKFTVLLLLPALVVELADLTVKDGKFRAGGMRLAAFWGLVAGVCAAAFILLSVGKHAELLLVGHFSPEVQHKAAVSGLRLGLSDARQQAHFVLLAVVAIGMSFRFGCFRKIRFPTILLSTVALVHAFHRPWWYYYSLHFAIPLAWLSAFAVARFLYMGFSWIVANKLTRGAACLGLAYWALMLTVDGLRDSIRSVRMQPTLAESLILQKIKQHKEKSRWIFSDDPIIPFYVQIPTPPELAIVPLKRRWSGQLNAEGLVTYLRQYRPEQIVVDDDRLEPVFAAFLRENYRETFRGRGRALYLRNDLGD